MVFRGLQANLFQRLVAVPKESSFWIVADYSPVNHLVFLSAMPMSWLEKLGVLLGGTTAFHMLDMIQVYYIGITASSGCA